METKEFKPILISCDEMEFDRHLHLIKSSLIPQLEKIKTEFLKLGLGPLTNEYLDDILFAEMLIIRSQLKDNSDSERQLIRIYNLLKEFSEFGNMELPLVMDFPTVDDSGNIVLTDEAIQELKDFHSTYVCSEQGIELLELHRKASEALNQLFQPIKAKGLDLEDLFTIDFDGNIKPSIIDYDLIIHSQNKIN